MTSQCDCNTVAQHYPRHLMPPLDELESVCSALRAVRDLVGDFVPNEDGDTLDGTDRNGLHSLIDLLHTSFGWHLARARQEHWALKKAGGA